VGAQLRVYRRRIRSVQATKKITRAMELISSSRIVKAQQRVLASDPYARALYRAVSLAASHSTEKHALLTKAENPKRAAILVVTADRGLAGAYSANILREVEQLTKLLAEQGMDVERYAVGRKAQGYYKFREKPVADVWTGITDNPQPEHAEEIANKLLASYALGGENGGVDEIHIVYTRFKNRVSQAVEVLRVLPLAVVDEVFEGQNITYAEPQAAVLPTFDFEPSADAVLDALLPQYVTYLVYASLLQAAASEHAARQRAMKSATENAEDLIKTYTRLANQARQSEITQEISEIVGGADALASATAGS
jgi:F-type H+-transporting ATPase subunit gamma